MAVWSSAPARNATPRDVREPRDRAAVLATLPFGRAAAGGGGRVRNARACSSGRGHRPGGGPDPVTHRRGSTSAGVTLPSSSPVAS